MATLLASGAEATVRVHIAGSYEEIDSFSEGRMEYVSLSQLVEIMGGSLDWEIIGHQVKYEEQSYRFSFLRTMRLSRART